MQKEKAGSAVNHGSLSSGLLAELNRHVSKAAMLVELYGEHANSEIRSESELGHVQREMKAIKSGILSELMQSKGALQQLQSPNRFSAQVGGSRLRSPAEAGLAIGPSRAKHDLGEAKG